MPERRASSPPLLYISPPLFASRQPRSTPDRTHAVLLADQQHIGAAMGEDPDRDDAGYLVEAGLHLEGIRNFQMMDVEDDVAVVGDEVLPPDRFSPRLDHLTGDERPCHRHDLDR